MWLAGVFVASLGIVRHLSFPESLNRSQLSRPRDFIRKSNKFPKGTFKARTSKRIFSQFSVFRLGLSQKRMRRNWRLPDRKAILLRVFERPSQNPHSKPCHSERLYREEPAVRWQLSAPSPRIPTVEIHWKFCGQRRLTGSKRACMFVKFRGQSVLPSGEIAWTEFAPLRRTAIRSLTTRLNVPVVRNEFGH